MLTLSSSSGGQCLLPTDLPKPSRLQKKLSRETILALVQMVNHVCPSVGPLPVTLLHTHTLAPPAPPTKSPKSSQTVITSSSALFTVKKKKVYIS